MGLLEFLARPEVAAPVWIERISVRLHLDLLFDRYLSGVYQIRHHGATLPRFRTCHDSEVSSRSKPMQVSVCDPGGGLLRVPTLRPSPERLPDDHLRFSERLTRNDVTVIVHLSLDARVEPAYQVHLFRGVILANNATYLLEERMQIFFEGVVRTLPPCRRRFYPRKSEPSSICGMQVFSGESCKPRSSRNGSTSGLTSFSSSCFELPVMMKSSA